MRSSGAEKTETVAAMRFTPRNIQARGQRKVPAAGKSSSAKKQALKRMPPIRLRRSMVKFVWRAVGGALTNEFSPSGGRSAPQTVMCGSYCTSSSNLSLHRPRSTEEGQRLRWEVRQVREDRGEVRDGHAEPICQRRAVLIDRGGGNPAAIGADVAGTAGSEHWHCSVNVSARHGTPRDHLHAAPGVIAPAVRCRLVGAAEVGHGKGGHLLRQVELDGGAVESIERRTELREQRLLRGDLIAVGIETAQGTEENLAAQAERGTHGEKLRDLLQLAANARGGEYGRERRGGGQSGGE